MYICMYMYLCICMTFLYVPCVHDKYYIYHNYFIITYISKFQAYISIICKYYYLFFN